ncbi:homeobox protein Meis2-like [Sycon ciliatum]|uniref:homeobox protein Meis2-like n=1 Tax=Sycon ciliatum TaxID=27933 RepID=UPI0031F69AEB
MLPMDETSPPTSDEERAVRSASNSPQSCHPSSSVTASASDATAFPEGMSALRRNLHPESSKQVLQTWLEENIDHPYPLEEKKLEFMSQTGLTMKQINYWFINARRRKVKSMRQQQYYRHAAANRAAGAFHTLEASTHPYHNMHRDRADHTLDSHYSTPQSASAYTATPFSGQSPTTLPSPTGHALHHLTTTASTTPMVASSLTTQPHFHAQQPHPHHGQTQQNLHQQQHPQLVQCPGAIEHSLQHSLNPLPARHHQATVWGQSNTATVTSQARATVGEWSTQAQQITSVPRNPPRTLQVAQATTSARHHGMESPQGNFRSPFTLTSSGGIPAATFPTAQQQQHQHQHQADSTTSPSDPNAAAVALSVRMPVIVQAHVHPLQQTPSPGATAVPMALQASTYMPWPVRVAPQVTLAHTAYPTNQLVYTPVSTIPSTSTGPFP